MKAPKIRFKGFEGDWQKFKIKDICINKGTGTLTKDKVASEYGYPVINGGVSNYGYYFDYNNENAITISSRGENAGYAKYNKGKFRAGGLCYVYESQKHNTQFIGILLNGKEKHIKSTMIARTTIPALNKSEFNEYFITIPEKQKEQEKIGAFFEKLDTQITQQSQKLEKLKNIKQSFLQKLFPKDGSALPELRFKGFERDWGERKLGEIFEEYSEKNHTELPVLTIMQGIGTMLRSEVNRNLQYNKNSVSNYKLVNKDDFIVHLRSFEGGLEKSNHTGIVSPAYHILHGENINPDFYYVFFRSFNFINKKLISHVYGIRDGKSIDIAGMKTINISYTSLKEQEKIGNFIKKLDLQLTKQQEKIQRLQNIKQSLLEKMFI